MKGYKMAYPLLGTKIVLDEEKILKEGKYNLEDMYKTIDEYAKELDTQQTKQTKDIHQKLKEFTEKTPKNQELKDLER